MAGSGPSGAVEMEPRMDQREKRIAYTNSRISFAKQCLEELRAMGPLRKGSGERLSEAQRSRRSELVRELDFIYRQFDAYLPIAVSGDSAFVNTGSLIRVYCEEVLPHRNAIHALYLALLDADTGEPRNSEPGPSRGGEVGKFFSRAIGELRQVLEHDPRSDPYAGFFHSPENVVDEVTLVERMGLLRPDDWIANNACLLPVATDRPLNKIPFRVRDRLDEIYDLFRLGQWRACVALSRALLELVLVNEKHLLAGPVHQWDESGRKWTRPIGELMDLAAERFPELEDAMRTIVQWANPTLHPGRGDAPIERLDRVERTWALECVSAIRLVCERIYS
jgi:hypothetical protein